VKDHRLAKATVLRPSRLMVGDLPRSWTAATIDQLCPIVTDGEHQTPPRTDSGVPLLSARNVRNGEVVFEPIDHVSEETYQSISRRIEIRAGDVLLTCSGSVGRSAVVEPGMRFALVRSVAVLRPAVMNSDFLSLALRSPLLQQQINHRKTETAQANIFQGNIRALTVPVPPLAEQYEIVQRVRGLMDAAGRLDGRISTGMKQAGLTTRAVLAKALLG
jgi:type I restriction enzyme S subunit